jgi:O-antigen/teichoic acid export membrane protein
MLWTTGAQSTGLPCYVGPAPRQSRIQVYLQDSLPCRCVETPAVIRTWGQSAASQNQIGMTKNIVANILGRVWGVVSVYVFVPLYLRFLGIEAYGLVGFYSTLLVVLAFADMGFTATLNREMARLSVRKDSAGEMRDLLRTYESAYLCTSSVLSAALWYLAPEIAQHWLRPTGLQPHDVTAAIRLMGVAVAFQLPSGLYVGGLMGLQQQVRVNCVQIGWGLFRGLGAVFVLWLFSPTIIAFALWQLISNALYCFLTRLSLWRALSFGRAQSRPHFKWEVFRNTWRYAAGMAGMAVVSILLTQTDKLAVSKMLPLETLGYYTLACTLAWVPSMVGSPIAFAVFPRLTGMVALEDRTGLTRLYLRTCELIAVANIPAGLTIGLFAGDCIFAWTGSAIAAQRAGLVASLLVGGQLMQAISTVPYYLALAHGSMKLNLQIGIASVVLITPLLLFLIVKYGVVGAGLSWLLMNLCTVPPYLYLLHRRFLPGELRRWCLRAVARPLLATLPCVLLGRCLVPHTTSRLFTACFIGLVWAVSAAATAATVPEVRSFLMNHTYRGLRVSYGTD